MWGQHQPCDVLWNTKINTTCSLSGRNVALLLLMEDSGEKQKKKEEEEKNSPISIPLQSIVSDENFMRFCPPIHYSHGFQIAIMLNGWQSLSEWHGVRPELGR